MSLIGAQLPDPASPEFPALLAFAFGIIATGLALGLRLPRDEVEWFGLMGAFLGGGLGLIHLSGGTGRRPILRPMGRREALTMMIPTWVACLTVMAVGYALGWSGGAVGSAMIGAGSLTIVVSMLVIVRRRSDAH